MNHFKVTIGLNGQHNSPPNPTRMKKVTALLPIILLVIQTIAQTDSLVTAPETAVKKGPYKATIKTIDGKTQQGWLYQVNDSQVVLLKDVKDLRTRYDQLLQPTGSFTVPADQVHAISLKRKNAGLKGMLIGFGVGALTGIVSGFISGDDPITLYTGTFADAFIGIGNAFAMTAGEKAVAGGLIFGTGGAIVGLIIGSVAKKKFIIGGNKEKVRDLHAELVQKNIIPR